ncbi:MAG: hypothetical protein K6F20_12640, partial [Bacteroidaceae bacterium]|nr:hypothetical protein [Bacteroidaceae bacterium]
ICFNLCDFMFHLKRKTPADAFIKTVNICAENHIFSKDDILTMSRIVQESSKDLEDTMWDVVPQNHENTRGAASYQ